VVNNMTEESKTEVIEMMLHTEADAGLKSLMQDHLRDNRSLEQLASVLQQHEGDE